MRKIYKILLLIFIIEIFIVKLLGETGLWLDALLINAVGAFCVFLPIWIIVILSIKDQKISQNKKIFISFFGLFIFVAYVLGLIVEIYFN